ncbi:RND transporter [Caballeronia novacaledonica]|uniref:RND transporter n=1 Tax=Caballeronia novacaledonica TaxID=1544861 RepID=A0A2U3I1Z7_9BURK|nr:TolC family protein [Caballeronia novacaledonica]SPB14123.1 RND transporter [Caballeronia novacaledonica]
MKKSIFVTAIVLAFALSSINAAAQELAAPHDLPPADQANVWIENDLSVMQARSALDAAGYEGSAIARSSNEWNATLQAQRRRYRDTGENSNEYLVQIQRAIRINGKAGLDRQLGGVQQDVAMARLGEARHESARALARLWVDVITASGHEALLAEQVSFAEKNRSVVERRKKAGDASALDENVARTDLYEVQRQHSLAITQLETARTQLKTRFPEAAVPPGFLSDPTAPMWEGPQWRDRILERADRIRVFEAEWNRAKLSAERASKDRIPDPVVGLYGSTEARNNERIVGINVTIPLPGGYRKDKEMQARHEAETARAAMDQQRQTLGGEVMQTYLEAVGGVQRWRVAEQGAVIAADGARRSQRAYELGEIDLQSLLIARRQSLEAARAALDARADAQRRNHELLVDAHLIWSLAQE